jgi:hypothetical protein
MYVIIKSVKNKKTGKSLPVVLLNTNTEIDTPIQNDTSMKIDTPIQNDTPTPTKKVGGGDKKIPHIRLIDNNIILNKEYKRESKILNNINLIEEETPIPIKIKNSKELIIMFKKQNKNRYLDFIYLTEIEYNKLLEKYNNSFIETLNRLDDYLSNEKNFLKYTSHYKTLCMWLSKNNNIKTNNSNYSNKQNTNIKHQDLDEEMNDYWNKVANGEIEFQAGEVKL